ncbi:MAG TPA: DUF2277 domain-containing protein [Terriglobia bacterium]|nr:DUF2277 domain-containing protein [Terriglobia bacterium]
MCRSIKRLRNPDQPATPEEVSAAARQFVRKISGFHHPSEANRQSFDAAIAEIATASQRLLESLAVRSRSTAPRPPAGSPDSGPAARRRPLPQPSPAAGDP